MASEAAILLKDIQGERSGKIVKSNSKAVHVCRGELLLLIPRTKLVPRKDGKPPHNYQLVGDTGVTLYSGGEDIAPLGDNDYRLLEAIKSREARYEVFQKDLLDWGSGLTAGTYVLATLPSKSPVSNQRAVSIIRYVGPLPNEQGVLFGVEIMEPEYRNCGSTDGYFGGEQFFTCEENCGLFVSLDRLLPMDPQAYQQHVAPQPADVQTHQMVTRSKKQVGQSDLRRSNHSPQPKQSEFKHDDRVVVHNKKGIAIHGSVRWMGSVQYGGETFPAIGIETDVSVQSKDFESAFTGLGQQFKCKDSRHGKLVMPEPFVVFERLDAAMRAVHADLKHESKEGTCVDLKDDERLMEIAKKQSEVEYVKGALKTSVLDPEEQARMLEEYERKQNEKQNSKRQRSSQNRPVDRHNQHHVYDTVYDPSNWQQQPPPPYPAGSQRIFPSSATLSTAMARQHSVDTPEGNRRGIQKMHDQHSVNDEYLLGGHSSGAGGAVPLMQRRSVSNVDEHMQLNQAADIGHPLQQSDDPSQHVYCNIPIVPSGSQQVQSYDQYGNYPAYLQTKQDDQNVVCQQNQAYQISQGYQPAQGYQKNQQIVPESTQARQPHVHLQAQQRMSGGQWHGMVPSQHQAYGGGQQSDMLQAHGGNTVAVAPQETASHSFTMGSTVQLQSDPRRYGVIQWIGTLPDIVGRIAGVELEEPMEGCNDGIWKGIRYFSCRQGHGFFCPLSSLAPDQRFTQTTVTEGNPLDDVAMEEEHDQYINPGQIKRYIGEGKGIQGQQNSCYLDSTVFGLFAVSDVFDSMFLDQEHGDPAGDEVKYLLWKGIVNPLRKNGVVRHESVMRLRNKLEELGKMKGVNQDEKDPEEFLNMLFKHTLHVTPFINIKRPFGVEQEYFVQLFVEHDASLKLPTVGDLLRRMFKEQKIRFTKVPSKLLIQIPRYGREFKTYQKTIPSIKLELKGLLSSKHQCFICKDSAWKECPDCVSHFVADTSSHTNVVYFCENCAQLSHGKSTGRDGHLMTEVAPDAGRINELDLLSVICIETSHYICFTRSEDRWIFFDSMANRVNDMYNIPKVVDCTDALNEWVYPADGDLTRLLNTTPRELPEYVRRFTQDIYLCVYIQPDFAMYGDFDDSMVV